MMDLETIRDIHVLQYAPHGRMLNVLIGSGMFDSRIRDTGTMIEKWRQVPAADIAVLIDGGGKDRAAMIAEPGRIVRAAAKK
jgi:hypothetical protein